MNRIKNFEQFVGESTTLKVKEKGQSDSWDRPIYIDKKGNKYVDVSLQGGDEPALHTTTGSGEPSSPVKDFLVVDKF